MFSQGGLSLEQAPPISVVLKFFVTASIFGLLLGLYLVGSTSHILPLSPESVNAIDITIVHTLALGVMASFMLGALFQMLPVIAGVSIKLPTKKSMVAHILLVVGLILQLLAFNSSNSILYLISAVVLGAGLLHASTLMLKEIIKIKDHSSSSRGMLFALGSFTIAILFGVYLLLTLGGYTDGTWFVALKEAHYSFAIFGWVTILIVSISFQVVEMFYVTPKYPTIMSKYLVTSIFMLLVLKLIALLITLPTMGIDALLALLFIIYAGVTFHRLYKRRRPTSDATVWFWRLGMILLAISMSIFLVDSIKNLNGEVTYIAQITFVGFVLSVVFAMVYKIVPFLVWFHLSNQGYMEAPMMHDVIHPKRAKIHFGIHLSMLITWVASPYLSILPTISSLLMSISFGWLLYHLIFAVKKYNYTQKYTEKIEW